LSNELDQILISSDSPKWHEKIRQLKTSLRKASFFEPGSPEDKEIDQILERFCREMLGRRNSILSNYTVAEQEEFKKRDSFLSEKTDQYDKVKLTTEQLRVSDEELQKAHAETDKDLLDSIGKTISNVRRYQEEIFVANKKVNQHPGIKYIPIQRVGICVPGASAPLPSTVIMCAVPAQVAGVKEIVVVSPPRYKGSIHPVTLAVCYELEINEVYKIGGILAVAAMAFGTARITPVNKIVGPGNTWVQTAKKKVFGYVGIDSVAGPSEVLIIADKSANPAWVAADMLSQAEHSPGSAVLFTDSGELANNVLTELEKQLEVLDRKQRTLECLLEYSRIIIFKDFEEVVTQADFFAAEHLEIQCGNESREIAEKIKNAGAIFIGDYSPVAIGDYWAGPSHTLPTGGSAKFSSALSANDFIKATSIIEYDKKKLAESAEDIIRLAEAEGLDAHAKSIKIRQQG
jgi:histidinol dehydrogenase